MFEDAKQYTYTGFRIDWDNYFRVYKGHRVIRNYEGVSDPVIRESHTIIETLVSNIASGPPKFQFVKTNEEQTDETDVLNGMLQYYMECNQMELKNQEWVREMLIYGTAVLHIEWRDGKPFITNIPIRDFFVDPTSTVLVNGTNPASYAGYEYLADKEQLRNEEVFDAKQNKYVPKYMHLDDIGIEPSNQGGSGNQTGMMDKAWKDLFQGSTLGATATQTQVHVIKMYHLPSGKLIEIGNKKQFIYYDAIPFQRDEQTQEVPKMGPDGQQIMVTQTLDAIDPFLPFAVLRDYVDSSQFYGEGEMAIIMGDAELLNDYESMDIDNSAYQNTPMYTIDPQFADMAPEIETIAGAVYPIPKGALNPMPIPQLANDLDAKQALIVQRMRSATAADEAVQGISQDQGRVTATEVSTQISQAQNRFSTKISNLESEGYTQLATVIFKMIQIFVQPGTAVRIVGKEGVYFKDFSPWDYNGEYEPHVELDSTIQAKQMEVGQRLNQIYTELQNDPQGLFNPVAVKRFIIQHMDPTMSDTEFNGLLNPPTPPGPTDEEQKLAAQVQVARYNALGEMYGDPNTTPFIQAQIETAVGLQADPAHEVQEQTQMIEHGAKQADLLNPLTDATGKPDTLLPPQPTPPPSGLNAPTPAAAPA